MAKQRRSTIPPELRAIARAIADADVHEFPDLVPAPGHTRPSLDALRSVTTEVNDGVPLTAQEFKLFRAAYAECRQHLHSVTTGVMTSGTPIAEVLLLAARMDAVCSDLSLSLLALFPSLREVHAYLLELSDRYDGGRGEGQRHSGMLLDRFVRVLQQILLRGEQSLRWYEAWEGQRESSVTDQSAADAASAVATAAGSPRPSHGSLSGRDAAASAVQRVSLAAADGDFSARSATLRRTTVEAAEAAEAEGVQRRSTAADSIAPTTAAAAAALSRPLSGKRRLPFAVTDAIASVNADLDTHFAHLRWYVTVTDRGSVFFDAHDYLEEHVLRAAWERYVGRNRPACTAEDFYPFLKLFPPWTHPAVLSVVDFKGCGVVSVYSLRRLLQVWGPLQLIEVNLRHDMERGAVELAEPFAYLAASLASRPDAQAGDYVMGLSENPGELRVAVLRRAQGYRWHLWAAAAEHRRRSSSPRAQERGRGDGGSPSSRKQFATVSYTLSHDTGAWMVLGLTREEFDSAAEACNAFPEIFQRPCGQVLSPAAPPGLSGGGVDGASPHSPPSWSAASAAATAGGGTEGVKAAAATAGARPPPLAPTHSLAQQQEAADGNMSALHRACYRNNTRYVRTLLERGGATVVNCALADPLVGESFCWTPLLCAVNNPHSDPADVVRLLLEAGADVHYQDDADCTALYYAIANQYAETTRVLLTHCPRLQTSPYTVPLLVAIGAHDCHLRECDVRRLVEVLPSAAVLQVVAAHESDMSLVALASSIVEEKVNGRHYAVTAAERRMVAERCAAGAGGADRYTPSEAAQLQALVAQHTHLCLQYRLDVEEAVRVLYAREYVLSWRVWLNFLDSAKDTRPKRGRAMAPIYPVGMLPAAPVGSGRNAVAAVRQAQAGTSPTLGALHEAMYGPPAEHVFGRTLFREAAEPAPPDYVI